MKYRNDFPRRLLFSLFLFIELISLIEGIRRGFVFRSVQPGSLIFLSKLYKGFSLFLESMSCRIRSESDTKTITYHGTKLNKISHGKMYHFRVLYNHWKNPHEIFEIEIYRNFKIIILLVLSK